MGFWEKEVGRNEWLCAIIIIIIGMKRSFGIE